MVRNSGNSKLKHDKLKPKIFESHESTLRTRFANPEPEPIFDRIKKMKAIVAAEIEKLI